MPLWRGYVGAGVAVRQLQRTEVMMRSISLVVVALSASGCLLWGGTWGSSGKKPKRTQITALARVPVTERLVIRLHLRAGNKLRALRTDWRRRMRVLVRSANAVVGPQLGLRLVLASESPWQRVSGDDDIEAMGTELSKLSVNGPRDVIVGLVTPLALTTPRVDKLGIAEVGGAHMVLRAGTKSGRLSADQVELLVFLHELGHVLGAVHSRDRGDFMFWSLNEQMGRFGRTTRPKLIASIRARVNRRGVATQPSPTAATPKRRAVAEPRPASAPAVETRGQAQRTDDELAAEIKAAQKQSQVVALIELRALFTKLTRREKQHHEQQDRLWILLARAYVAHHADKPARRALAKVRTPGIEAVAALKRQLAKMHTR